MPCRNRNKDMGSDPAAPVAVPLATEVMVASLLHRKQVVEVAVWTENSQILVVAVG